MRRAFVVFAVIFASIFTSCNSSRSGDREPVIKTEEVVPPAPSPSPAPVVKDDTVAISAFYIGEYDIEKEKYDEYVGEMSPHTKENAGFQLDVVTNGITKSIPMTAGDYWNHKNGEKDPGKTEELKKLYESMKTFSVSRFRVIITPAGVVKEVFLLPEYKDGKDGTAGTIVSPQIQIYPNLMVE